MIKRATLILTVSVILMLAFMNCNYFYTATEDEFNHHHSSVSSSNSSSSSIYSSVSSTVSSLFFSSSSESSLNSSASSTVSSLIFSSSSDSSQSSEEGTFIKTMNYGSGNETLYDIATDDNYIYLAGNDTEISSDNAQMRMEKRYKSNGELVTSFGNNGIVQYNYSSYTPDNGYELYFHINIDGNYIYLASMFQNSATDRAWQIQKRDKSTGALVNTFGTGGLLTSNPSSGLDNVFAMTADAEYIYLGGEDYIPGNGQWHLEKRNKSDGALVTSFNTDGIYQGNYSTLNDGIYELAVDASYIYAAGTDGNNGTQWHLEKINKLTGELEPAFGTNGILLENPSSYNDRCYDIIIDGNYMYLGGQKQVDDWATCWWRMEKRDLITGELISTFGVNGIIDEYLSEYGNNPSDISLSDGYLYISGSDSMLGSDDNKQWRIEKRNISDGALVSDFGNSGVIQANYSSSHDATSKIIADNNFIYIAGSDSINGNRQWRLEKRYAATGGF